jgi:hypothetical protein
MIPSTAGLALAERLREIDNEGVHVPIVVTPPLAVQGQRGRPQQKGAIRGRSASAGGCDPVVFGMQILAHLERLSAERPAAARAPKPAAQVSRITQAPVSKIQQPETAPSRPHHGTNFDWSDVLNAMRREIEREAHLAPSVEAEDPYDGSGNIAAIENISVSALDEASSAQTEPKPVADPSAASAVELTPKKRRRKVPAQDEFGFFDPDRCGVSALIAKVNEITGQKPSTPKKPA